MSSVSICSGENKIKIKNAWGGVSKRLTGRVIHTHTLFFFFGLGPAREAWLRGSSLSHWGLLPRKPAAQSHLHHVSVSTWTTRRPRVLLWSYADWQLLVDRQTQHMRNIAEELDPTFQARRRGPDSGGAGQSGSLHRQTKPSEWNCVNNLLWLTSFPFAIQGQIVSLFP